jgi:hypothetical protein
LSTSFNCPQKFEINLPINDELRTYYEYLIFEDNPQIGGRFNLFLFSPDELTKAQHGWRWIQDKSGNISEDLIHWNPKWIVIADQDGDVVFVETESGEVFGSIQKRNIFLARTLADFLTALTETIKIEMDKYNFDAVGDDFAPLPEFLEDAKNQISMKLGNDVAIGFMKFFFG